MGVTWHELQETPGYVVEDYLQVMEAEVTKAQRDAAEAARRSKAR